MTAALAFHHVERSHIGKRRKIQQDAHGAVEVRHPNGTYQLLILADGMGGGMKGEVASRIAVETVVEYFQSTPWYSPGDACREAVFSANRAVYESGTGGGQATRSFMGTTLVLALFEEQTGRLWLANVGDSRAYLIGGGRIEQVTRDHSFVAEHANEGSPLSANEVARLKNVVTRAVGLDPTVEPDAIGPIQLTSGTRLLLSSDGLHGVVPDERIRRLASGPMEQAARSLIDAANAAGGPDNVTVVLGEQGSFAAAGAATQSVRVAVLGAATASLVLVSAALVFALLNNALRSGDSQDENATPTGSTSPPTPVPTARPAARESTAEKQEPPTAQLYDKVEVTSGFLCDRAFEDLLEDFESRNPGSKLSPETKRSLADEFAKHINESSDKGRKCPNGLQVNDMISLPNMAWLKAEIERLPDSIQKFDTDAQ